jgi:hypothetical protein
VLSARGIWKHALCIACHGGRVRSLTDDLAPERWPPFDDAKQEQKDMTSRIYAPRNAVPGGAAKRAFPITEAQYAMGAGRGPILKCDSSLLKDPDVREVYECICRSYPLRAEAAPVAAAAASYEVRLHRLQAQAEKSDRDRELIGQFVRALGACLIKLTTLYLNRPHEILPK